MKVRLAVLTAAALTPTSTASAVTATSTSYSPCSAGSTMADGTPVRFGSVASNWHPLGTRIYLHSPVLGRRKFTVRDRIGHGSSLDIWVPSCAYAIQYGRRRVTYSLGWPQARSVGVVRRAKSRGLGQSRD